MSRRDFEAANAPPPTYDKSIEQDIVKSDVDLDSGKDSDDERMVEEFPMFNTSQLYDPSFEIGMKFLNKDLLRKAIHSFAIKTRRSIKIVKNDKMRVHAKCANKKCKWALHGLSVPDEPTFRIRLFNDTHTCKKSFKVKNMSAKWLAGNYLHKFQSDPERDINRFWAETIMETKCDISPFQAYRAKRQVMDTIAGDEPSQKGKKKSKGKPQVLSNQHRLRRRQTKIVCENQHVTTKTDALEQQQNKQVKRKGCQSPATKSGKCFKTPPKPFYQLRQGRVESGKKKKKK